MYLTLTQVLQLRGKLDMMMKRNADKQPDNNLDIEQEALAGKVMSFHKEIFCNTFLTVYQDTSSDESDDMMSDLMINDQDDVNEESEDQLGGSEDNDEEMLSESD